MNELKNLFEYLFACRNSKSMIAYLRKRGITIGENCVIRYPKTCRIDTTRPSLITIGNNVDMNRNFQILTHDYSSHVFKNYYGEFLNSSGEVIIGNNIYFGTDVIILKGVTIGDNCIIAAGSLVTKNIPNNSVAAGVPCKVISSLDDYFIKRKEECVNEALLYAKKIYEKYKRKPVVDDFSEEFIHFIDRENMNNYPNINPEIQLGKSNMKKWLNNHQRTFNNFEDFLIAAGIE